MVAAADDRSSADQKSNLHTQNETENLLSDSEVHQGNSQGIPKENKDLYVTMKTLDTRLEFLTLQEDYIRDDQKNLKRELIQAKREILRIRSVPLVIGQFLEMIDENHGIVTSTAGSNYFVRVLSTLNKSVLLNLFYLF